MRRIHHFKKSLLLFFISVLIWSCQSSSTIYVAVDGDDKNEGSKTQPLRTLEKALTVAKASKSNTIILKGGTHYLSKTISLGADYSGTKSQNFVIQGAANENVILSGAKKLSLKWKPLSNGIFVAKVPKGLNFDQLFVNGEKQIRARYPNIDTTVTIFNGYSEDAVAKSKVLSWKNPIGGFVHAMHRAHWGAYHYEINGVDEEGNLDLIGGYQNNRQMGMHKKYKFVENIKEELDAPKEWFLDLQTQELYYYPVQDVNLDQALIEVPQLDHLVEIKGDSIQPARHIALENINFRHTNYTFMKAKEPLLRSDWAIYRGGAVLFNGAENCTVTHSTFVDLGGNGVFVNNYNRHIAVNSNYFTGIGASAICFVGDSKAVRSPSFEYHQFVDYDKLDRAEGPKTNNYPAQSKVYDNLIHDIGTVEKQIAGVQISMAAEITIAHNSIYNLPRAGINVSEGTWGGHMIEHNDVFNTVLETGDHGSFNSWGRDRFWHPNRGEMNRITEKEPSLIMLDPIKTTVIRNNRFRCDHGWDIDLDDGSTNYHIYNNLCLNGGLKLREGFYRTVENNIMVNNTFHPHVWFKNSGDIFRRNIVLSKYRDIRLDGWGKEIDYNIFPDSLSLADSRSKNSANDVHSVYGNPDFIAPEKGDFRLNEGSIAFKVGFKNFAMDKFGVVSEKLKKMAAQPEIPTLVRQELQKVKNKTIQLAGMTLKNIEGLGERSAAGLDDENGVIIMKIEPKSAAEKSGLQVGDVILKSGDQLMINNAAFYEAYQTEEWKRKMDLTISRNQKQQKLTLVLR